MSLESLNATERKGMEDYAIHDTMNHNGRKADNYDYVVYENWRNWAAAQQEYYAERRYRDDIRKDTYAELDNSIDEE